MHINTHVHTIYLHKVELYVQSTGSQIPTDLKSVIYFDSAWQWLLHLY